MLMWLFRLFPCKLCVLTILPDLLYLFPIVMPLMCSFVIGRLPAFLPELVTFAM